jgi:Fe-S-cluster-containing hydrogenase component 2
MRRKILIDLLKLRDYDKCPVDGIYTDAGTNNEFKTIREQATFLFTCRKCEEAPCISICPAEALEKDENGIVSRSMNLCIRCKSCITICPFGTLMDDLFEKKPKKQFFNLNDDNELLRFVEASPGDTVVFFDGDEDVENHIYKLNERVFVKDFIWNS